MKKNEIRDLHEKSRGELIKQVLELRKDIAKLSIDRPMGKMKNTNILKTKKKDIARILTILTELEERKTPQEALQK